MQRLSPNCIQNRQCKSVCIDSKCAYLAFVCDDQMCECSRMHKKCEEDRTWKKYFQTVVDKLKTPNQMTRRSLEEIESFYREMHQQLNKCYEEFAREKWKLGLNEVQVNVLTKLGNSQISTVTGSQLSELLNSIKKNDQDAINLNIEAGVNHSKRLIQQLKKWNMLNRQLRISSQNQVMEKQKKIMKSQKKYQPKELKFELFKSKIQFNHQVLHEIFYPNRIGYFFLLYRASENGFSIKAFHQKCDNKGATLTLILTEHQKIIGGFTSLDWQSNFKYKASQNRDTFLFSITNNQKLTIVKNEDKEIVCDSNMGPIFGSGYDLCIGTQANKSRNSWCRIGGTYNINGQYKYLSQESQARFSGSVNGSEFSIIQWEVYNVIYE